MKEEELEKLYWEAQEREHAGRLERLKAMNSAEDSEGTWVSHLANKYYEDARLCWVYGAFVATIVMCQIALEELIRAHYRRVKGIGGVLNSGKEVDKAGFAELCIQAKEDGIVNSDEFASFQRLRKELRNPYVHVPDITPENDFEKHNFVRQLIKITAPELGVGDVVEEAKEALTLLVTSFHKISRRSF